MRRYLLFSTFLLLWPGFSSLGWSEPVTNAAIFAQDSAPRQVGMADAAVGLADDLAAVHYNPAALAGVPDPALAAVFTLGILDATQETLTGAYPLEKGLFGKKAVAGFDFKSYQGGQMDYIQTDDTGQYELSRKTISAENDYWLAAGYAESLANGFSFGIFAKGIVSTLAQERSAWAGAADLGLNYREVIPGLSLGASLLNLGTDLKYLDAGDSLPLTARLGAGYVYRPAAFVRLKGDGDIFYTPQERAGTAVGLEGNFLGWGLLRTGLNYDNNNLNWSAGAGLILKNFEVDYAARYSSLFNWRHVMGLTWHFSTPPPPAPLAKSEKAKPGKNSKKSKPAKEIKGADYE